MTGLGLVLPSDAAEGWIVAPEFRVPFHRAYIPYRNSGAPFRVVWHQTQTISATPERQRAAYSRHRSKPQIWASFAESNGWVWGPGDRHGNRRKTGRRTDLGGHDTILQSVPLTHAGWALKNDWSGWETNHQNCAQVEFEGWSAEQLDEGEEEKWAELTALIFEWNQKFGAEALVAAPFEPVGRGGDQGWGTKAPSRAPKEEWMDGVSEGRRITVFTHQNVGSGNDHWDCGRTRNEIICDRANRLLADGLKPVTQVSGGNAAIIGRAVEREAVYAGIEDGLDAARQGLARLRELG